MLLKDILIIHSIRYIGGKREVAVFENHRALGPIIKVIPIGIGKGACIAVLTDPNYEVRFFFCINNHRISGVLFSTKSIPVKRSKICHILYTYSLYEIQKLLFTVSTSCYFIFP